MSKRSALNPLVLTAALVIGAGPYVGPWVARATGLRGGRNTETSTIANVDIQKVYAESEARVQAEERVQAFGRKAGAHFEEIAKMDFITPEETNDISVALNTEKPTDAQTKQVAAIRASNASRTDEYQKLTAKKDTELTAQDRTRLRDLNAIVRQRPEIMGRLQKIYQGAVDEEETKENRQGVAEVRAAIQKLAKDQAFTQVFDMSALVYAPNDLTDQAVKKLKAKGK